MLAQLYEVVYADPPWRYSFSRSGSRRVENHYPTMSLEDIKAVPVAAAADSILFLWATAPKLREALAVVDAWGFDYKTHAVWDKVKIGMGYYFRGQHELLLVGTRGTWPPPHPSLRLPSVFREARGRHSAKPATVRASLEMMYPYARRVELFARERVAGWDAWGNAIANVA